MSDNTQTIQIEALDTLFFRDGKPFSMGEDTWADGIFPPPPSVIYGALRTAYFAENPDEFHLANTENDPTKDLEITGFAFLWKNKIYYPAPLDLVDWKDKEIQEDNGYGRDFVEKERKNNEYEVKLMRIIDNEFASNTVTKFLLYRNETVENFDDGIINNDIYSSYINGEFKNYSLSQLKQILKIESKIGIARNNQTNTTIEGNLFRVGMRRPADMENKLSILVRINFIFKNQNLIKLGGENKVAEIKPFSSELNLMPQATDSKYFKIILNTPAIFENGWIPNLQVFKDFKLELITCSIGKYQQFGGFDMKARNGKGYPKKMYKAVPAGSVFYYKISGKQTIKNLINFISENEIFSISDRRAKEGFGLFHIANYDFEKLIQK